MIEFVLVARPETIRKKPHGQTALRLSSVGGVILQHSAKSLAEVHDLFNLWF